MQETSGITENSTKSLKDNKGKVLDLYAGKWKLVELISVAEGIIK